MRHLATLLLFICGLNLAADNYHFDSDDQYGETRVDYLVPMHPSFDSLQLREPSELGRTADLKSHGCHFGHCNHVVIHPKVPLHASSASNYDFPIGVSFIAVKSVNDFLRPPIA